MADKVSIIIPCYNDSDYIETAVNSAFNQKYQNKEIIVVDDGSNKKTKAILKKMESKIDCLLTQKNQGPAAARNRGINIATGKYIITLDSDDYFEESFCGKAVEMMENSKNVKVVTCCARWFKDRRTLQVFRPSGGKLVDYLTKSCALGNALFLRGDWHKAGGYDEEMKDGWEDWEFYIRLHKDGGETYVIPEVLFNYRNKNYSRTTRANKKKYVLYSYMYGKHKDLFEDHPNIIIPHLLNKLEAEEKVN